jgi:hypothetical protein
MNPSTYGRLALVGALAACGQSNSNATSPADGGGDDSGQGGFDASTGDSGAGLPAPDASTLPDSGIVADGGGHAPAPDGAVSLVQVPLGAYVGTWLGDTGSQYYTSWSDHWTAFVAAMGGRVPTVVGLPGMPYPATDPDQWPNQSQYNVSNWPSVLPKSTSPLLTIWYVDANEEPIYAQAVDGTAYAGHPVDYWVQQTLQPYADFGVKKIYLRPAWEWNIAFQGQGITGDAGVGAATFVSAMQGFYTAAHTWGQANGVNVRVTWDPSVYGQDTNGISLAAQFPDQNPGDHYVDVICADFYAFGNSLATAPKGGPTVFTLTAVVALSQQWNLPLAFCELGDGLYDNQDPTLVWLPNLIGYLQQLSTASPPVPIEFMNLWDIQSIEWTPPQVDRADEAAAWKAALGTGGSLVTLVVP